MRKNLRAAAFASGLLTICISAQSQTSISTDLYSQASEMTNIMVQYNADRGSLTRFYSTTASPFEGRGAREGQNTSSPERRERLLKLIADYEKIMARSGFEKMNINGKVDYILFLRNLEDEKDKLQQDGKVYDQIVKYLPFASRIYVLEKPRRRGANVDGQKVAKELNDIYHQVIAAKTELKKETAIESSLAMAASAAVKDLQGVLKNYFNFYNGYDPMFSWWVPKTYTTVDSILNVYAADLRGKGKEQTSQKDDGSGIIGKPVGREELIRQLRQEFIPYSPEELVTIANKEFAWCDAELLKASNEMGFGKDWKAAQEKLKNSYVPAGQQPAAMLDLYQQSVDFLKKNDLVTIPELAEESWRVYMMSPERQLVAPFFLGGESLIISYPTNTMEYEDKLMSMRGNNPYFSRATVHHELIAGHHMQQYMTGRNKTYRNFSTPFWSEGNSLYWELLLWDLKFPRNAEERMGMLFWRMHRCARIIFSLNYHLGNWTPQQCIDFLVDRVGHERANAEGEVRRSFVGGYPPLYQLAYMIGGMQLYSLKKELVDSKKMTLKQYHDAIFRENSLPIEMLRAILINQQIKADFKTSWRFYDLK